MLLEIKDLKRYSLTQFEFDAMWHGIIPESCHANETHLCLRELSMKHCHYAFTIKSGIVVYHGIVHELVAEFLTNKQMREFGKDYAPEFVYLGMINSSFASMPSQVDDRMPLDLKQMINYTYGKTK